MDGRRKDEKIGDEEHISKSLIFLIISCHIWFPCRLDEKHIGIWHYSTTMSRLLLMVPKESPLNLKPFVIHNLCGCGTNKTNSLQWNYEKSREVETTYLLRITENIQSVFLNTIVRFWSRQIYNKQCFKTKKWLW